MKEVPGRAIIAGTRGSRLALAQTDWVIERLLPLSRGRSFERCVIKTSGDAGASELRGEGVFVKEIQRALLSGEVDLAVHSLKDVPTEPVEGVVQAAIPDRADPREALVGGTPQGLPPGATVGTSSLRRAAQMRALRPDLKIVPLRGNVPTRVRKVESGELDAVLLARAGLLRLGLEGDAYTFDPMLFLPAPGQGALAIEVRADDAALVALVRQIDDAATRTTVGAEREVLRRLGGGCMLPVGAYGWFEGGTLQVIGRVVSADGTREARAGSSGARAAEDVARALLDQGALELIADG